MAADHPNVTLDHCVVHVADWERSNAFYRTVLGAEVVPVGAGFAYRFGSAQLNLHGPGLTPTLVIGALSGQMVWTFILPFLAMCQAMRRRGEPAFSALAALVKQAFHCSGDLPTAVQG